MNDLPRHLLEKYFGDDPRLVAAFEDQAAEVGAVGATAQQAADDTNALKNATVIVLSPNGEFTNEKVLEVGDGIDMLVTATTVRLSVSDSTFVGDGDKGDVTVSGGGSSVSINVNVVTNDKLADMEQATFKMRAAGGGTGDPIDGTAAQAKAALAITAADVSGLGYFATGTDAANLTGTVAAARLPQFTGGDVTTGAPGSVSLTIGAGTITLAKMANLAANSIIGNNTGGAATPIALSAAQTKVLLAITAGDVSGLAAIATSGSASDLTAGTVPAARMPAHTGDVTSAAGTVALTIANDAVSNAKLANMAEATIKGRAAGAGTGDPTDLTPAQAKTLLAITAADIGGGAALTRVDDTNITLTLSGTPGSALLAAVSLTLGWTGTLAVARGGTGAADAATARSNLGIPTLDHGTYTPTLFNTTNVAASTAYQCQYLRVGNTVTVSGRVDVDPTAASVATLLGISLPIASNLTSAGQCCGAAAASGVQGQSAAIIPDTANDRASLSYVPPSAGNAGMFFTFTYQVA